MGLVPTARLALVTLVTSLLFNMFVPKLFVPLKKTIVPVGLPAPGATALTCVVNATGWPKTGAMVTNDTTSAFARSTVCVTTGDVLPR